MSYLVTTGALPHEGVLPMSMLEHKGWQESPFPMPGRHFAVVMFGDDQCGPFAALNACDPMPEPYKPSPGHGHRSDSWRISVTGQLRMGAQRYGPGGFRFQEGGVLYGADDNGWSPQGAQAVVLMADRRGTNTIPAAEADREKFAMSGAKLDAWLGRPPRIDYPIVPGVATTLGAPCFGKVDGTFAQSDTWAKRFPGVRMEVGLCGDRIGGPVVLLIAAEPGATAMPELSLPSEVLHIVIEGSTRAGSTTFERAGTPLVEAQARGPALQAGDEGLKVAAIVGDRRALEHAVCADAAWLDTVRTLVRTLQGGWDV